MFRCRFALILACLVGSTPLASAQTSKPRSPQAVATDIDAAIKKTLAKEKIPASPAADDAEFLRRTFLLMIGRLPTSERVVSFLESKVAEKRHQVTEELLASPLFGEHLANHWSQIITIEEPKYRKELGKWLTDEFNKNTPWNRLVHDLVTHEGGGAKMSFVMSNIDNNQPQPNKLAGSASRLFLGVQLQCAECHDHPFTQWKQTDFWGVAAFFSRVKFQNGKGGKDVSVVGVTEVAGPAPKKAKEPLKPGASIIIPTTAGKNAGKVVSAKFLEGNEPTLPNEGGVRANLANWMTSADNKYFARAFVNRMWAHYFGRGIVHPIDDMHDDNAPAHPEVLDLLTREFTASGFDVKHLVRCITSTKAYQRTSTPLDANKDDVALTSRMNVQVMNGEVLYDALVQAFGVTQIKMATGGGTAGAASGRPQVTNQPREKFIKFFNTSDADASPTDYTHGIPQALALMNDPAFNNGGPIVEKLMKAHTEPAKVIEGLFLATLSRRPSSNETTLMTDYVARRKGGRDAYAGVLWILVNTEEFVLIR